MWLTISEQRPRSISKKRPGKTRYNRVGSEQSNWSIEEEKYGHDQFFGEKVDCGSTSQQGLGQYINPSKELGTTQERMVRKVRISHEKEKAKEVNL